MNQRQALHQLLDKLLDEASKDATNLAIVDLKLETVDIDTSTVGYTTEVYTSIMGEVILDKNGNAFIEECTFDQDTVVDAEETDNREYGFNHDLDENVAYMKFTSAEKFDLHEALCKAIHEDDEDAWDLLRQNVEDISA